MKKQLFVYLFAALAMGSVVTSCSDDEAVVNPVADTTVFTNNNGLALSLNGEALLGKEVKYIPSSANATQASLEIKGSDFDIMKHLARAEQQPKLNLSTPGILPGTAELKLDLNLVIEGDRCSFEGQGETDYCTYSYTGNVSKSSLNLDLKDVKLKNTGLVGQWNLVPLTKNEYETEIVTTPLHLLWDSSVKVPVELFPGYEMQVEIRELINTALNSLLVAKEGDENFTAIEYLCHLFKDVRFGEDGNVTAQIKDVVKGKTEFEVSPKNVAFYVVDNLPTATERGQLRLFLNLETIDQLAKQSKASRADDGLSIALSSLLTMINPLIQNGIPVTLIQSEEGQMTIILDTKLLLPVLKVVAPLFKDENLVNTLIEMIKSNPDMAGMASQATAVIKNLPAVVEGTSKIEIGLSFTPAK